MIGVMTLYRSSVGKKAVMAVTGLIWIGFIIFHMYGNLKVFGGSAYFNEYSEGLREIGAPIFGHTHLLWLARIVLLGAIVLHIWAAIDLSRQSLLGRPMRYSKFTTIQATFASLTMRWGGAVIFFFIIYHLLHFTFGTPGIHNDFIPGDPYHNLVTGFQFIPASIFYILGVIALGFHLYHGTWSMFQTLGFNNQTYTKPIRALALIFALVIALGFISIPVAVMVGIVS
ncbi:MAG: succinate dehydrogenase cytochrome b subunit [Phycisphaerae bacterium]|nr:succinate dehydrogenase cytochrome b subunit [Phycisphaerae bacterium]NIX32373.1 succinate dehydrogenase [Phycisphaerae bacterium]